MTRTPPLASVHDPWRQAQAAQTLAGELADLVFGCRLPALDPTTRRVVMRWAEDTVRLAVDEFADAPPDAEPYDARLCCLQAWRERQEREDR